jgi:hypothetical protein
MNPSPELIGGNVGGVDDKISNRSGVVQINSPIRLVEREKKDRKKLLTGQYFATND